MTTPARPDLYIAIQELSLLLNLRVEYLGKKRGWPSRGAPFHVALSDGSQLDLTTTQLHLPGGDTASFTPRPQPEQDGCTWHIDIQRNNSVLPGIWSEGIYVALSGARYQLHHRGELLSEDALDGLLEALGARGSTMILDRIIKGWVLRYGELSPRDLSAIQALDDIDKIDALDALLHRSMPREEAREAFRRIMDGEFKRPRR